VGKVLLKHVKEIKGCLYFRRKIAGRDTYYRLPAIGDPAFAEEYQRYLADHTKRADPAEGTIAWLVAKYRPTALKIPNERTRTNNLRYLAIMEQTDPAIIGAMGSAPVAKIEHHHLFRIREKMVDHPGKWNNYLAVASKLFVYAMNDGRRKGNPCSELKRYKTGEHLPWPDHILDAALEEATPMTRLAIITMLCTGQRIGDTIRIQPGWITDDMLTLTQQKRGHQVFVPDHPMWREARESMPRPANVRATTVLWDRYGKPFASPGTLRERINDLMKKISPDYRYHPHGLRKNACCYLAEAGLTALQIKPIVGMNVDQVEHYTRHINNRRVVEEVHHLVTSGNFIRAKG
jgi:integrase